MLQFESTLGPRIVTVTLAGESVSPVGAHEYKVNVRTALSYEIESLTMTSNVRSLFTESAAMIPCEALIVNQAGALG